MKTQSPDTTEEAERLKRLRQAGPLRRLQMALDASRAIRELAWNGLRQRHPQADEAELRRRFAELTLGESAALRMFEIPR